ncbi:MAG: polysaccharide deacetylase family protein, partial [Bacillota bacterium]|nr:polysaccharide deacetylase family protein [Bacillota bacterium]
LGSWVELNPSHAKKIIEKGHEIGNHTYNHPQLTKLSKENVIKEITAGEKIIEDITGHNPKPLFRPPYGATNNTVLQAILESGYQYSVMWSIDTRDWTGISVKEIIQKATTNLHPGAIILMHVNNNNTPEALPAIIDNIIAEGYTPVTLSQLDIQNNIAAITPKSPMVEEKIMTPITEVKYQSSLMPNVKLEVNAVDWNCVETPRLHKNRTYISARDVANIFNGEIVWDGIQKVLIININDKKFKFHIDGKAEINSSVIKEAESAILINNRAMIPLYVVAKELGLQLTWQGDKKIVTIII